MSSVYYAFANGNEATLRTDDDPGFGPACRAGEPIGPFDSLPDAVLGSTKRGLVPFMEIDGATLRLTIAMDGDAFGVVGERAGGGMLMLAELPSGIDFAGWLQNGGRTRAECERRDLDAIADGLDLRL